MSTKKRRETLKKQGLTEIHGFFVNPKDKEFFRWLEKASQTWFLSENIKAKMRGVANGEAEQERKNPQGLVQRSVWVRPEHADHIVDVLKFLKMEKPEFSFYADGEGVLFESVDKGGK